ncbi:gas vesicle structural protein GvpA [Actinopolymorpha alba]|uniref:gas vesicle structural protein GvpA n=1 Tax=Actinopolymorpha alba TaxID=533267 RepID=UPI0003788633|nr:gas vesicle structural protein GvpA [Actinopolymorpha alba]
MTLQPSSGVAPAPRSSSLYDVLELILDKGLVIDAYIRVSLVGIELLTIDARIVVASVDTYLRFAEAVNRLDLTQQKTSETLPELVGDLAEKGAKGKTEGALEGVAEKSKSALEGATEKFTEAFLRGREGEAERAESPHRSRGVGRQRSGEEEDR